MEDVLIPLIIFGTMFAMLYVFLTTRNKERLALIEKGADAKLFKSGPSNNWSGVLVINVAFLAIGIGVGVLLGSLLEANGMDDDIAFPAMIFICGGVGLLSGFFVSRKLVDNKKTE
ncbi:MAG: hypothetical protein MI975_16065 [Cytophagales bacterium]|nr:hypothetical protein [Cytophagales bacterium]